MEFRLESLFQRRIVDKAPKKLLWSLKSNLKPTLITASPRDN